jgi:hypothetical protein
MAEKKLAHRSVKSYVLSGIILVVLLAGFFFWRNYKYRIVNKKVEKIMMTSSKGLYELNYSNLVINETLGNLSAENLQMVPDTGVYRSLVEKKTDPDNLFYIHIPRLLITGVKTPKALLNKEISAHIIRIENARIIIRQVKTDKNKKSNFAGYFDSKMYRQLLGKLNSITADSVVVENASMLITGKDSSDVIARGTGLSLRFAGIAIDSTSQSDSLRILFSKDLSFHFTDLNIPFKNKVYSLSVSGLDFNSHTNSISSDQIRLKPRLSESAFARMYKFSKDRADLLIGHMHLRNLSRSAFLHQELIADTLEMAGCDFHIFRDKSLPHDSVDRTHNYPQEALMLLSIPVFIKKMLVKDSYIEYKEKNDVSDSSGKVSFFHVDAQLDNVTNMMKYIRRNNQMRLDFKASFLNEAPFSAIIVMRLNDPQGHFQLNAKLGQLNAISLNPLLKPMALAELKKGKINGLQFHLNATNTHAKGKLTLLYNDLSIRLLKKDDDKNKYKTKVLPTLAAGLVVKDSNPSNGKTRIGDVNYDRDIHRSIFQLMWKALFTGIKEVAL